MKKTHLNSYSVLFLFDFEFEVFFKFIFPYFVYVCAHAQGCTAHTWRSEDRSWELFVCCHVGSGDWTEVLRVSSKHL